ncbi:MAG: hypothetical protein IJE57_04770, partial [Anaerotignum sp.]|nr:hypothetical protein [Anaerotignum sp.]
MNEQTYISRQISVYMTDKKLVEFLDKLKPAPTEYYAHIHSFGDKDEDGVKQISCVGIILQDYSNGTGKKTVRVSANISPDEAEYIFLQVKNGVEEFRFEQDKIFGENDENGRAKVTKLRLARAAKSKNGEPRKYPWYIEIGNGTGVKVKSDKGGYFIKGESYKESAKVYINISDLDFFKLMLRVSRYIENWEAAIA